MAHKKPKPIAGHPFFCHCGGQTKVIDTRIVMESLSVRRRRVCKWCKARWTTREVREDAPGYNGQFELAAIREQAAIVKTAQRELRRLLTGGKGIR